MKAGIGSKGCCEDHKNTDRIRISERTQAGIPGSSAADRQETDHREWWPRTDSGPVFFTALE